MNERVVSSTGSVTRLRMARQQRCASRRPTTTPPRDGEHEVAEHRPARRSLAVIAAVAVRSDTSAVASLSRLSPSRIDDDPARHADPAADGRRGDGVRRCHDGAERQARGERHRGSTVQATRPTTTVVKTTAPTARMPMACRLARTSTSEVRSAAA